jgi:Tol biopolymer transport system component/uncharacterized protein YjdB
MTSPRVLLRLAAGLATLYVACVLPGEPSGAERIQFTFDFPVPYHVPLAGTVEPTIGITAGDQVLGNPHYRLESLDGGVVRVDATGRGLEGVARGAASVRAIYQTATGAPDTVFPVQVVVSRVSVSSPVMSLTRLGATTPLRATAYDAQDAAVPNVAFSWSSADVHVATVDDTGLVRAVDEGTVAITAEADAVLGTAAVTVTQAAAQVRVAPGLDTLRTVRRSIQFIAVAFDETGDVMTGAKARWSSSAPSVASVDASGLATADSAGTTKIIARVGSAADTATLVVKQVLRFLVVAPGLDTLTAIDDTGRVSAIARDSLGSSMPDVTVSWATNDPTIATVDQAGLVRAVKNGVALVTAASGGQSAFATIAVRQEVASAQISPDNVALTGAGATAQLSAAGLDRNGYPVDDAAFTWRSGSECVATVDAGLVTARGGGETVITATPADGGQPDTAVASVMGAPAAGPGDIAFESPRGIEVLCPGGSGPTVLIANGSGYIVSDPSWSPDGGRLAFTRSADGWATCAVYTARADGSEVRRVTFGPECDLHPAWSPDGTKLAFASGDALCTQQCTMALDVVNVDGSNRHRLLGDPPGSWSGRYPNPWYTNPTWSPDGTKLAIENYQYDCYDVLCYQYEIVVVNVDGTGEHNLTPFPREALYDDNTEPAWSPDGSQVAFVRLRDIWLINADGSSARKLTATGSQPAWSPDGAQIVFASPGSCQSWPYPPCGGGDLYLINRDGTGLRQLTSTDGHELKPAWRPAPPLDPSAPAAVTRRRP